MTHGISEGASETFSRLRLPFFLPGVSDSARHGQAGLGERASGAADTGEEGASD